jgi:endoglucanase
LPGFADSALAIARKAWGWARLHPIQFYRQTDVNSAFTPAITTGEYGDNNAADEFFWAGTELYLATREDSFYVAALPGALPAAFPTPSWGNVQTLGLFSLADNKDGGYSRINADTLKKVLMASVAAMRARADTSAYAVPMGNSDFNWGSNSVDANEGMMLVQAFRLSGDSTYLWAAVSALDYLLGRNATAYSFVTGYGSNTPFYPHHRPSAADGILDPVPGLLVGGPNPGQNDACPGYPSKVPALSYLDDQCAYASNEIAINWNAPYAYLAGSLEAILGAGVQAIGVRHRLASAAAEARLHWEGGRLLLDLPAGWTGHVDLFDLRGAKADVKPNDTAGLWVYRLRAYDRAGREVVRSGTLSTLATARIALGR